MVLEGQVEAVWKQNCILAVFTQPETSYLNGEFLFKVLFHQMERYLVFNPSLVEHSCKQYFPNAKVWHQQFKVAVDTEIAILLPFHALSMILVLTEKTS